MTITPEAPPARSLCHDVAQALPGIALAAPIAALAYLLSRWITKVPLNPIMVAVVLGGLVSTVARFTCMNHDRP